MEKKLHTFFQSGLLDKYILDEISASERLKVEQFIETYPEVESEYLRLQDNLEILAKADAVEAPKFVLDNIKNELEEEATPVITLERPRRRTPWYSIAASIVALLFAGGYYMKYQQNQELIKENQVVVDEIFDLRSDIEDNNKKLDNLMRQFMKLNNPETEKYVLRGNARAKDLKTVAYINAIEKTSMIDVVSLPQLSEDQFIHLWAEMEDHFVSLGILDPSQKNMQSVPYMENALGLSITIGPKENADKTDEAVAEIELKNRNN
ncbi:anti-sigma factor [Psychroserpens luteolus]|uniref:RNA polymerase subunit sigma-70 n=1 Tax=Psychroserpens luteolus TaxID=2855840 RepID=UPI001E4AC0DF|nr:RNA polymerase subunit sigma-70 [Psychroserpens luteolus]MCD2260262.1 RNA polymerase subunit sigma-70 [Psychroserpens luteolus]